MAPWSSTPLFEEIRAIIRQRSKAPDTCALLYWLLTHFEDDGTMRDARRRRRDTITLRGVTYYLVKKDVAAAKSFAVEE